MNKKFYETHVEKFLTLMIITVVPVFLMFISFEIFYDAIHPATATHGIIVGALLTFIYSSIISYLHVKKRIKRLI